MLKRLALFVVAGAIYISLAVYLYQPYFERFSAEEYLFVVNASLAAMGCFVLSRRWVAGSWASFFAGAAYGFGPFMLGLAKFHSIGGFLAAMVPWLFCPAAFWTKAGWRWLGWLLSALPFLAIVLFFQVSAHFHLFPVPIQTEVRLADLAWLLAPLVAAGRDVNVTLVGLYHVPMAALLVGLLMLVRARRVGVAAIFTVGTALALSDSFLGISPIMWLSIPVLCCSVLVGVGMQGLVSAGPADRRWVLAVAAVCGAMAIGILLIATRYFSVFAGLGAQCANLFVSTARMYILAAVALAIIFFIARTRLRITALRWAVLCSAAAVDIFLGARLIVDSTF
jgi:hypothetical protein